MKSQALIVIGGVFLPFYVCAIAFLMDPSLFFWRAWEYHLVVGFRHERHAKWEGHERGDLSRRNLFYFQESWPTTVTVDEFGFRSVPLPAEQYPIVVFGDSMAWGSGLSDDETLAWQLAERWRIPVYNGARTKLANIVNHPKLGEIETFIHLITEVNASARHVGVATARKPARFRPLTTTGESMFDTMAGNVGWWSPWANLQRSGGRFVNDLFILWDHVVRGIEPPTHHFLGPANCEVDMDLLLNKVRRNRDFFAARGARYAFIVVPSKRTVIGSNVGAPVRACNLEYLQKLIRTLRKEHIPTVDLIPALQAVPEPYMAFDTHWNGSGVQAAAQAIADRMRKEGVVRSR